jgi:hypothetical protein
MSMSWKLSIAWMVGVLLGTVFMGCITGAERTVQVTYPDGRIEVTTTTDIDATVAMLQAQLSMLEQAVNLYRDIAEWNTGQAKADAEAKAQDRAEQAEQIKLLLQGLGQLRAKGTE